MGGVFNLTAFVKETICLSMCALADVSDPTLAARDFTCLKSAVGSCFFDDVLISGMIAFFSKSLFMLSISDLFPQGGDSELVDEVSKKSAVSKDDPGFLGTSNTS